MKLHQQKLFVIEEMHIHNRRQLRKSIIASTFPTPLPRVRGAEDLIADKLVIRAADPIFILARVTFLFFRCVTSRGSLSPVHTHIHTIQTHIPAEVACASIKNKTPRAMIKCKQAVVLVKERIEKRCSTSFRNSL